jgi:hypothetical protein
MGRPPLHSNFIPTMANRISNLGFPPNIFHSETYAVFGYMDKNIASLLRPLSPYSDDRKLQRVLLLGVKLNFFNSIHNCQPKEFYKFLRHLRTSDGQVELQKLSMQEKLEKRAAAAGPLSMKWRALHWLRFRCLIFGHGRMRYVRNYMNPSSRIMRISRRLLNRLLPLLIVQKEAFQWKMFLLKKNRAMRVSNVAFLNVTD